VGDLTSPFHPFPLSYAADKTIRAGVALDCSAVLPPAAWATFSASLNDIEGVDIEGARDCVCVCVCVVSPFTERGKDYHA